MSTLSRTIEIAAPPATVWRVIADVTRWPEWTDSVRSVQPFDGDELAQGRLYRVAQPGFPPAVWQVTWLEENRGFTWVSRGLGFRVTADHQIEEHEGGSRVKLQIRSEGMIGRLVARLTRDRTIRYVEMEAAGLKKRSEEA